MGFCDLPEPVIGFGMMKIPRLFLSVVPALLLAGPAYAQTTPPKAAAEISDPDNDAAREAQDRKYRTWERRANQAVSGICVGCSTPSRPQPPPFATLPDTDDVPMQTLEPRESDGGLGYMPLIGPPR